MNVKTKKVNGAANKFVIYANADNCFISLRGDLATAPEMMSYEQAASLCQNFEHKAAREDWIVATLDYVVNPI